MRPTLTEAEIFKMVLIFFLSGAIFGALYDLFTAFRIFRGSEKQGRKERAIDILLCFFEDILFFLLISAGNVVLFSAYGGSKVRLEGIASELIAFVLWHMSAGKLSASLARKVKKALKRMMGAVYEKTVKPLVRKLGIRVEKIKFKKERKAVRKYSAAAKAELKKRLRGNTTRDQR